MKKHLIWVFSTFYLASCGYFEAPLTPTPKHVNQKLQQVDSGTTVDVVALVPMDVPNQTQPKITNSVAFRVSHDVYGQPNSTVLIKQNSFIIGVYNNDGKTCRISWQAIYPNYQALEQDSGALTIAEMANNTVCNPELGIRPGQLMKIVFK